MFNFNTLFQNIVRIFAVVVRAVNTIVQNVTGGEGGFATFMQTFTHNVNTLTGPSPEEIAATRAREAERIRLAKAQAIQNKVDVFDQQAEAMKIAREIDTSQNLLPKSKLQPQQAGARKGILAPVLTPDMEAQINLGGTPILTTLQNLMTHEREMVRVIVDVVGSVDAALSYMLSEWGADEDVEFDKEAAIRYVQYMLQAPPTPTPTPFAFSTNTPQSPFATNTPQLTATMTPEGFINLQAQVNLVEALPIDSFTYYNSGGNAVGDIQDVVGTLIPEYQQSYHTLSAFLDPNGPYKDTWWFEDGAVTPDELLAVLVFEEGQTNEAIQKAIFARYVYYTGGNFLGPSDLTDQMKVDQYTSRMIRFLSYFQPWREPRTDLTNPVAQGISLTAAQTFLSNPDNLIPGASNWNPNQIKPGTSFEMLNQTNINGQPTLQTPDGLVPVVDWAKTPWHFVNIGGSGILPGKIGDRLNSASIGTGRDQVADRILDDEGNTIGYVLTPEQTANFCDASADGFVLLSQDCSK